MSKTKIPEKIKILLWGKAAGRCEYEGCNKPLWFDSTTKFEFNTAYIAHIIADVPDGPRGDLVLSPQLKKNLSNLMLMCDEHHRLIDHEQVAEYSVDRLQEMKKRHERRIELLTSLTENHQSHVLLYGANIGNHASPVSWAKVIPALLPSWMPAEKNAIEISLKNSTYQDREPGYWQIERENLERLLEKKVKPGLASGEINHLSIFGLAPQPLLVLLGHLLSDIPPAQVYQLHREPPNWVWQDDAGPVEYNIIHPERPHKEKVALVLSLSATISHDRITDVIGDDVSIWTLAIDQPHNDFLKSREHLAEFRRMFRKLMDEIKAKHGQNNQLHLFPAVPVSVAIEIGRVRMPKADLPLLIYDQNNGVGGFTFTMEIR